MKSLIALVFLLLIVSSCSHQNKMPPDIFPVDKMKTMVWDLEFADQQAAERFTMQKDSLRMDATSLYQQVFAKHKTNRTAFYKIFSFYESHPELMKTLFDSVSSYGNRQKANAYRKAY